MRVQVGLCHPAVPRRETETRVVSRKVCWRSTWRSHWRIERNCARWELPLFRRSRNGPKRRITLPFSQIGLRRILCERVEKTPCKQAGVDHTQLSCEACLPCNGLARPLHSRNQSEAHLPCQKSNRQSIRRLCNCSLQYL